MKQKDLLQRIVYFIQVTLGGISMAPKRQIDIKDKSKGGFLNWMCRRIFELDGNGTKVTGNLTWLMGLCPNIN